MPLVGIIMGSKNDKPKMQPAGQALQDAGIRYEVRVMSAHRDPEKVREYCHIARMRGLKVIIAGAGIRPRCPASPPRTGPAGDRRADPRQEPRWPRRAALCGAQMPPGVPSPASRSTAPRTPGCSLPDHHA